MSAPRPLEEERLTATDALLTRLVAKSSNRQEARFQLLEAASSRLGGFDLARYWSAFGVDAGAPAGTVLKHAAQVVEAISATGIHPALALSALAREQLPSADRRNTGAYHTDFRLAFRLADMALGKSPTRAGYKAIDPACGAGILLAALAVRACASDRRKLGRFLAESICAADRTPLALRGALLSLASLTADLGALRAMRAKWVVADSLMADQRTWTGIAPRGFDLVIGNPPWEKVKLSRHEFLRAQGKARHYGAEIHELDHKIYNGQKAKVAEYADALADRYPALRGEPDLYIAFMQLFDRLCAPSGAIAVLVPAGLIRSKGTSSIRQELFDVSVSVSISVFENRARFFSIDTRFKFLAVATKRGGASARLGARIELLHERGTDSGVKQIGRALIGRRELSLVRPDLSVPEVRNPAEWRIFKRMIARGVSPAKPESEWSMDFCREVDMTRDRPKFTGVAGPSRLPLIEGRMVHHHRIGSKGYVAGSGRSALWKAFPTGAARIQPQFWIDAQDLPASAKERHKLVRAGFCDITGQTNERSMMAAVMPSSVAAR